MTYAIIDQKLIARNYDLRCVFDYANRPTWASQWNSTKGEDLCNYAWFNNKEGMIRARIEGKHKGVTLTLVECDASVFNKFQWEAIALIPSKIRTGKAAICKDGSDNEFKVKGQNIGLTIVTKEKRITVYVDGSIKVQDI